MMLRNYSLNNPVHDRAMDDFIAQERHARSKVEKDLAAYRELLAQLANRLDGQNFETMRQADPGIPANWTPEDWHTYLMQAANQFAFRSTRWGPPEDGISSQEREGLDAEIAKLKHELEETRAHLLIAARKAQLEPPEATRKRYYPPQEGHKAPPVTPETEVDVLRPDRLAIPSFLETLDDLRHWFGNVPAPPTEYQALAENNSPWHKYLAHIYLIGRFGLSSMMEIIELVGAALEIKSNNGSLKGLSVKLKERNYLTGDTWSAVGSQIKYWQLTPQGRVMYKTVFGKEPVETEWERLIRLHRGNENKAHAAACSLFALQARWRGYTTTMLPDLPQAGKARPDILIEKDGERLAVEVEMSTKDNITKWRNLAGINGGLVALCAGTAARRNRLAGDCRLAKIPGMATDIEFFRSPGYGKPGHDHTSPLWAEQWT
jgi:hypothetical protein